MVEKRVEAKDINYDWEGDLSLGNCKFKCPFCGGEQRIDLFSNDDEEICDKCNATFHLGFSYWIDAKKEEEKRNEETSKPSS